LSKEGLLTLRRVLKFDQRAAFDWQKLWQIRSLLLLQRLLEYRKLTSPTRLIAWKGPWIEKFQMMQLSWEIVFSF